MLLYIPVPNGFDPVPDLYPELEVEPDFSKVGSRNRIRDRNKPLRFHNIA